MPRRYLELEELRLTSLVTEWLEYEATRIAFEVADTEVKRTVHINGLTLNLQLDRIDRLNDGTLREDGTRRNDGSCSSLITNPATSRPKPGSYRDPTTCSCRSMPD